MTCKHACGPTEDVDFFSEYSALIARFPDLAHKYQIVCVDHETDIMGIDFTKQVAVRRIVGRTVVTEFKARAEVDERSVCCAWNCPVGQPCECVSWWIP